jgi:hypothetical protein
MRVNGVKKKYDQLLIVLNLAICHRITWEAGAYIMKRYTLTMFKTIDCVLDDH